MVEFDWFIAKRFMVKFDWLDGKHVRTIKGAEKYKFVIFHLVR
jgi:hypothetical protein